MHIFGITLILYILKISAPKGIWYKTKSYMYYIPGGQAPQTPLKHILLLMILSRVASIDILEESQVILLDL